MRVLQAVARRRLAIRQGQAESGPLAVAQKSLRDALWRGDVEELRRQSAIVRSLGDRRTAPVSPVVLRLIEMVERRLAHYVVAP